MKKSILFTAVVPVLVVLASGPGAVIHMIGDSTMADKPDPERNPERGWGQVLSSFFTDGVSVRNHAVNGRSTKSFIREGRWDSVRVQLKKGDCVFIQFGHNDAKITDSTRYTNPYTGYRRNLIRFVKESRAKGAIPVLFSPIVRRKFNEQGVLEDAHGPYPFIMRDVARELKVPFVDMQLMSEDLVLSLGPERSKELYLWVSPGEYEMYPEGKQDNTHFTEKGATEMAKLAVYGLKELDLDIVKCLK
ncbi:rhamnogalacturonan acetylesterase [bacterium]|nr:rhamnogalacturonan acetylesterase [bacterium]